MFKAMKVVIQRVQNASVEVDQEIVGKIYKGLLIFLGINHESTKNDADWLVNKCKNLRIFDDEDGVMNLSVQDIQGEILVISQFTLHALTKKGNRPSYIHSAPSDIAAPLYNYFISTLRTTFAGKVASGSFGADMKVKLLNDGPVTIIIDAHHKE